MISRFKINFYSFQSQNCLQGFNSINVKTKKSLKTPELKSAPVWSSLGDNVTTGVNNNQLSYLP